MGDILSKKVNISESELLDATVVIQSSVNFVFYFADLRLCMPTTDFYLGIADLTGELMRLCITSTSKGDLTTPFEVAQFLRKIYTGFLLIGNQGPREMGEA